ncbi:CPNA2-like protein [Mya arenaria]|uniref:CPNA2-like protein n=1 Tax=Mya arenaria TaxID=6604 RepID=A0ABY7DJ56_MYAAR|nr:copine family protein 1-like [Mya arenaria]WAQ96514.1 CPNA2-like protein [Mya arenaria]
MSGFTDNFTASSISRSFLFVTGATDHSNALGHEADGENSAVVIEDRFQSYNEVRKEILKDIKTCSYMIAIDYTLSNISQGQHTNEGKSLHDLTGVNPYQRVILALGETLEPFKEEADEILIVGFGDKKVKDKGTFRLSQERCETFYDVFNAYNEVTKHIQLSGPTNFAPVIYEAINTVKRTLKYHILIIVADGQVVEEKLTHDAIIEASHYPLSIVVIGVGDGPWGVMEDWDDRIRGRKFDNLQFVDYHKVTSKAKNPDVALALAALMEIPDQYREIKELGLLDKLYQEVKMETSSRKDHSVNL